MTNQNNRAIPSSDGLDEVQRALSYGRNQCPLCRQFFKSNASFDKHRIGSYDDLSNPRRCLSDAEMLGIGMSKDNQGFWITRKRLIPALLDALERADAASDVGK